MLRPEIIERRSGRISNPSLLGGGVRNKGAMQSLVPTKSPERWKSIVRGGQLPPPLSFNVRTKFGYTYARVEVSLAFPVLHRGYSALRKAGIRKGDGGLHALGSFAPIVAPRQLTTMSCFPVSGRARAVARGWVEACLSCSSIRGCVYDGRVDRSPSRTASRLDKTRSRSR